MMTRPSRAGAVSTTGAQRVQVLTAMPSLRQDSSGAHAHFEILGVHRIDTY